MAVKIGHASKDENGRFTGGDAGDQTGKEVCTRNWYNGSWDFVARFKDRAMAKKAAAACAAGCSNDLQGYDQGDRNTGLEEAKKANWDLGRIAAPCEFDCSSFVTACVMAAEISIWSGGNAPTTRTLRRVLEGTGEFEILTDSRYLTSDAYLLEGDILCKEGSHTVMVLENGRKAAAQADQAKAEKVTTYCSVRLPRLEAGSEGAAVQRMQQLLLAHGEKLPKYGVDGDFGKETGDALEEFQRKNNLSKDRKCGPESWAALITK